ncbi:MAG: T9SS type A sorting domain-containing protein [Bacteroidia bacterium]|nr:T9SS type A sorting domain-containing protein [Bacteroidia bacterium]
MTENQAPYAAGGNSGNNYKPIYFSPGTYTLTATPFADRNLKGDAGQALTVTFTVINTGPPFRLGAEGLASDVKVYPNPVTDFFQVEMELKESGNVRMELYNSQGQVLIERTFAGQEGAFAQKLNVADYPAGLYFLRIEGDTWSAVKQIAKD